MMSHHQGYVLKFSDPKELRYPQPNCMHKIGNHKTFRDKPSTIINLKVQSLRTH